jgi:2-polyprenyl-3-methyl-5-hydroxy-6-metoxy-1,4-benzoquinol methylase
MYEKIEICPICKSPKSKNHLIINDHSISNESFALVKCTGCNLLYTNPRPDIQSIWKYYEGDQYISHTNKIISIKDVIYKLVRNYTTKSKFKLLKKYHAHPSVLDYGCGSGFFLTYLKKQKLEVVGVEPAREKTISTESPIKNDVVTNIKEISKDLKVDIITAWHVIEHVHELIKTLKQLRKRLKPGGHMFIALPNPYSFDALYYKEYWAGYDVPRHLYHFDKDTIKALSKKLKMKLVHVYPMIFDSYYVSMLSEKYQGNRYSFIQGLKTGYLSNQKAKSTGEYSSLIYVLRK